MHIPPNKLQTILGLHAVAQAALERVSCHLTDDRSQKIIHHFWRYSRFDLFGSSNVGSAFGKGQIGYLFSIMDGKKHPVENNFLAGVKRFLELVYYMNQRTHGYEYHFEQTEYVMDAFWRSMRIVNRDLEIEDVQKIFENASHATAVLERDVTP